MQKNIFILVLILCFFVGCKQVIEIKTDDPSATITTTTPAQSTTAPLVDYPSQIRILFGVRTDFPSGVTSPDVVYINGGVLSENSIISTGKHTFSIEKRGYHKKTEDILVEDQDGDGNYTLTTTLESKERVIIFDIRDNVSSDVLKPDQVSIVTIPDGKEQTLSDRSSMKPGRKKIVIQKHGYRPFSQEITIDADEDPYILNSKLIPLN
ncbi:MAG: hypothetical protein HUU50_02885 [Candidatus Brocadiae bacterium]|nr:hypothetical protein [Candidatus Brocadiia bacterium]